MLVVEVTPGKNLLFRVKRNFYSDTGAAAAAAAGSAAAAAGAASAAASRETIVQTVVKPGAAAAASVSILFSFHFNLIFQRTVNS